ncbi:MAG: hypothetical protein ACI398_01875 [Clostridium sp.]
MNKKNEPYLPKVRSDYKNPCNDNPIVVNNIADREFNYTDDFIDDINSDSQESKNSKKN